MPSVQVRDNFILENIYIYKARILAGVYNDHLLSLMFCLEYKGTDRPPGYCVKVFKAEPVTIVSVPSNPVFRTGCPREL